jgi:hypothetical protein
MPENTSWRPLREDRFRAGDVTLLERIAEHFAQLPKRGCFRQRARLPEDVLVPLLRLQRGNSDDRQARDPVRAVSQPGCRRTRPPRRHDAAVEHPQRYARTHAPGRTTELTVEANHHHRVWCSYQGAENAEFRHALPPAMIIVRRQASFAVIYCGLDGAMVRGLVDINAPCLPLHAGTESCGLAAGASRIRTRGPILMASSDRAP